MKLSLFENGPFVAAFFVNQTWEDADHDGIVQKSEPITGGHAILVCGYDNKRELLKFKNSWGSEWGDNGYGYLPYSDVEGSLLDAWSAVDLPEAEEGNVPVKSWFERIIDSILSIFKG